MIPRRLGPVAAWMLAASNAGCSSTCVTPRHDAPLAVEIAGCASVRSGPVCEVSSSTTELSMWLAGSHDRVEVSVEGLGLTPRSREVEGGKVVSIALPKDVPSPGAAAPLTITALAGARRATHRVTVERVIMDPTLERVEALRTAGKIEEAARAMPPVESFSPAMRGRAQSLAARLALAAGRTDEAIAGLRRAMAVHRAEGRVSDEVRDAMALSHTLLVQHKSLAEAREVLDQVEPALRKWDEGRARIGFYRALVLRDTGDLRSAARELRVAETLAARLGLESFQRRVQQASAKLLQLVGDDAGAARILRRVEADLPRDASTCERAEIMTNRAWYELSLLGASGGATQLELASVPPKEPRRGVSERDDPATARALLDDGRTIRDLESDLREILELWQTGCPKPAEVANVLTNLSLAALLAGDADAAAEHVEKARAVGKVPAFVSMWLLDVEARIALARNDPRRALALYDELRARATAAYSPEPEWRALVGRGTAHEAAGELGAAEDAYRSAEMLLDDQSARVPLNDGRSSFLSSRDPSVRRLVDLLLRRGDAAGAMAAIRTARARALQAVQRVERVSALPPDVRRRWESALSAYARETTALERASANDWAIPADRLEGVRAERRAREQAARASLDDAFAALAEAAPVPAVHEKPQEGELLVAFQASPDGRVLHEVWQDAHGAGAAKLTPAPEGPSDAEIARWLLEPLAGALERAKKVKILSFGPLADVDFHALPLRGAPLLAHVAVEYPADLAGDLSSSEPRPGAHGRALVIADTQSDLPNARAEAAAVTEALRPSWDVMRLEGDAATRDAVAAELTNATLVHFAGHASFDGARGWESALYLSKGEHFRVGDVLALPRVPDVVVLSGCETGKVAPTRIADMSLANAFVAAGARVVIAASRPVDDRVAAELARRMYEEAARGTLDVAESFRRAQLEMARRAPDGGWRAYRITTR